MFGIHCVVVLMDMGWSPLGREYEEVNETGLH